MKLGTLIMGVILGSLFMAMLGLGMADISGKYGVTYGNETAIYNTLNNTYDDLLTTQQTLNTTTDTGSNIDVVGGLLDKGIAAIKISYSSAKNAITLTSQGADALGIPLSIQLAMISVVLVFIVIIVIKTFTRSDI